MDSRPAAVIRWLVSPTGFVFVLLCFSLPFVAASCEGPMGSLTVEYSGADLVFGGEPTVTGTGFAAGASSEDVERATPQVLAILAVLAIVAGLVVSLLPISLVRPVLAAAASLVALVTLAANQLVVRSAITRELEADQFVESAGDMVHTRAGFVLALVLLAGLLAYNVVDSVLRGQWQVRRPPWPAGQCDRMPPPE